MMAVLANAASRPAWLTPTVAQERTEGIAPSIAAGRELARLATEELVCEVHRRAASGRLNRGLALRLPYFDGARAMRHREMTVVPRGAPVRAGICRAGVRTRRPPSGESGG
jgi:hypothetical protein